MKLDAPEIDFLRSLSSSDLDEILSGFPETDQRQIRASINRKTQPAAKRTHREIVSEAARKERRTFQAIEPLPFAPMGEHGELRRQCDESLRSHLLICYPGAFPLKFAEDHERLIAEVQTKATVGGLKAIAMPRSSGKSTILVRAILWAILSSLRKFGVLITATDALAGDLMRTIRTELLFNPMIRKLYPQETHALRMLENEARRAGGQRYEGELTNVAWESNRIAFGWVPGVPTSGAEIQCLGLTGSIRGLNSTLPSGEVIRPDFLLVDEPQNKKSAKSPAQNRDRHELVMGDCLGMAGPNRKIAGVLSGTVIYRNDLMDRVLDRSISPDWNGDLCKMVYDWPERMDLWDEYRAIQESELDGIENVTTSIEFVRQNYDEMHRGSRVGWEERTTPDHVSALHYAFDLRFRDAPTFWAEYQNQPARAMDDVPFELDVGAIVGRTNGVPRGIVPDECEVLTAFVDVQKNVLFYGVVAWEMTGRGHLIDYGTYPDQGRLTFSKRNLARTLYAETGIDNFREAIYEGMSKLTGRLLTEPFQKLSRTRGDASLYVRRLGIDARWGYLTKTIRQFCRESRNRDRLHPMMGHYIGPDSRPWHKWTHRRTDYVGVHCKLQPPPAGHSGNLEVLVDTNWWKSYVAESLSCHVGAQRSMLLFEAPPHHHQLIAEHLTAEDAEIKRGKSGNSVVEFVLPNDSPDNDWWDVLVGNAVISSIEGVRIDVDATQPEAKEQAAPTPPKRVPKRSRPMRF